MSEDMFAWYSKACLLKVKQTLVHVDNLPNKLTTWDKIEPLGFQGVGFKNRQLGVTWFKHFVVPFKMKEC
jgi:hypothetical protein